MRHLLSLLAGLVLGPMALVGLAWGTQTLTVEYLRNLDTDVAGQAGPLTVVVLCGVALGVLLAARVSPLGSLVAAGVFLAPALLWLADPGTLGDLGLLGNRVGNGVQQLAASGTALAIGVALLVPVLVPSRWRRWRRRPASAGPAGAAPAAGPAASAAPAPPAARPRWDDPRDRSRQGGSEEESRGATLADLRRHEPRRDAPGETRREAPRWEGPEETDRLPAAPRPPVGDTRPVPPQTRQLPGPPLPPR